MGVYLVNVETINAAAMGTLTFLWYPLCCLSFILIWNVYSKTASIVLVSFAKAAGIIILLVVVVLYKGGDEGSARFASHWWVY
jgi:hypothetical protein